MTVYRIYTINADGCSTLKSEFVDMGDQVALRDAFEALRRSPTETAWLLECDPDDAQRRRV